MSENKTIDCGEVGQRVVIFGKDYYIGDVVRLYDKKYSAHYQIVWSDTTYQVLLQCPTLALASVHPDGSRKIWHSQPYIRLIELTEGFIPYLKIERIGNDAKALKLVKPVRRVGLKPY